jgi:hypothetical protein
MEPRGEIFLWRTKNGRKEMANAEQNSSHLWRCGKEGIKDGIWYVPKIKWMKYAKPMGSKRNVI